MLRNRASLKLGKGRAIWNGYTAPELIRDVLDDISYDRFAGPPIRLDIPFHIFPEDMGRAEFERLLENANNYRWRSETRKAFVKKFAWAIPDWKAIEIIARYSPIIEIGAGSGFWARLLANAGAEVLAFDDPESRKDWIFNEAHYDIQPGSFEKVAEYPGHTPFLCWPPMNELAFNCLKHYQGEHFIYIGEGDGGCTADDEFFRLLENEGWEEVEDYRLNQWDGINDYLTVYKKKPSNYR